MEKLMTSTPSRTARATAAAESESKQPSIPHTLYDITHAPGAIPWTGGSAEPRTETPSTTLPADVVVVCVPCPLESRAVWKGSAAARAGFDRYVLRKACPPM